MKLLLFVVERFENAEKRFHTQSELEVVFGNILVPVLSGFLLDRSKGGMILFILRGGACLFFSPGNADQGSGSSVTSESPTCRVGIHFAVVDCIPVLLGVNIGMDMPVVLQLPTHFIGPETVTTPVSFQLSIPVPDWDQHLWLESRNPL